MINRMGALSAAGTLNVQTSNRRVTHLLIGQNTAFVTGDKLTVELMSTMHEPIVICNRVSCLALTGISDFLMGQSQSLQEAVNLATGVTDYVGWFMAVPVGNLDLRATESELKIIFETVATKATVSTLSLEPDSPDRIEKTLEQSDLNSRSAFIEHVFLHYATGSAVPFTDTALDDITVNIDQGDVSDTCTIQDVIGFTAVLGELEAMAPTNTYCAYQNQDDLPDDIGWNITGSDNANVKVIVRTKEYKTRRLVANTVTRLDRDERKLAVKSPQKRSALQLAGVSADLNQIRDAKKVMQEVKNKQRISAT
jgi:hypothetical protein